MEEAGCFSSISSSDDDPWISNSIPEDASDNDGCDIRFADEFDLLFIASSFSLIGAVWLEVLFR